MAIEDYRRRPSIPDTARDDSFPKKRFSATAAT